MWKSWRVRKRHWVRTTVEIFAPVLLVLLLVSVRAVMEEDEFPEDSSKSTTFVAHDMKYLVRQLCQISCGVTPNMRSVLAYAPSDDKHHSFVTNLMLKVQDYVTENNAEIDVLGFESETEIEAFNAMIAVNNDTDISSEVPVKTKLLGAVIFLNHPHRDDSQTGELVYKIRLVDQKFITGKTFADMEFPGPGKHYRIYETSGFLGLQLAIDQSFLELVHGRAALGYKIEMQAFPYPPFVHLEKTHFTMILSMLLPAAIIIGFSYLVTNSITEIAKERESRVTHFLHMLGLNEMGYWLGWTVNFSIPASISILMIVALLTLNLSGDGAVLIYSSVGPIYLFLFVYLFAAVWFCLFISTFFNSSGFANSLGVLAWMASFIIPALLIGNKQRFLGSQLMASILPNMCLYWGFHTIANWEARVIGIRWSNMIEYPSTVESQNMALIVTELLFDGFFYMILTVFMRKSNFRSKRLRNPLSLIYDALYDDTRFPECLAIFRRGSACCRKKNKRKGRRPLGMDINEHSAIGILRTKVLGASGLYGTPLFNALRFDTELFEREVLNKGAGIKIRNLSKSFKGESVIKGLSCDFYKNEITVLLGPNGAGKTTLMNILTGMLDPEEGAVYINRYDIRDYKTEARRSIGLCPQGDMLFEELTVMEHLMLFAWLRGGVWHDARVESRRLTTQLNMRDVAKTQVTKLTGGQRRKLCFAIAVIGGPKVILLDEVTTGMDSESRKAVWNILQKLREDRTILLTTHSMEEADVLADRIAIMSDGTLKSFGTPQFLKKVYGSGYTLKFRVAEKSAEKMLRIMTTVIPEAQVRSRELCVGGEDISFQVSAEYAPMFPAIFDQLHLRKDFLGIHSIDIHQTSMEEIFLGVKETLEFDASKRERKDKLRDTVRKHMGPRKIMSIVKLAYSRFNILLQKHLWMAHANTLIFVFQYALPLALVISGIAGANRGFRNRDLDRFSQMKISLDDYDDPISLFNIADEDLSLAWNSVIGHGQRSTESRNLMMTLHDVGIDNEKDYRKQYIIGAGADSTLITALFNTVPYHAAPLAANLVSNTLLKYLEPNRSLSITVENHPMQAASRETLDVVSVEGQSAVIKAFCFYIAYALAIVCAFIALRPLKEKSCGSQHIQLMSGTHPFSFWFTYLLVDGAYLLTLSGAALLLVWLTEESTLYTRHLGSLTLFLIFSVGGYACINFSYCMIHILKNPGASFGWFNVFHLSAAFFSFIIYQTHPEINDLLSCTFYWCSIPFPIPFVVHALHSFAKVVMYNSRCAVVAEHVLESICDKSGSYKYLPAYGCCANCDTSSCFKPMSYFFTSFNEAGYTIFGDLIMLSITGTAYFILVVLVDAGYFQKIERCCLAAPAEAFDSDDIELSSLMHESAAQEAEKVRKLVGLGDTVPKNTGVLVDGICKNYGSVAAVSNVSFSTKAGECFGILGLTGAGKTSVFQILAGAEIPAVGDVYLLPYSLLGDKRDYLSCLGYCSQKSCLLGDLTGRQLLVLYGTLRGISKEDLPRECQYWLAALGLENDADRQCKDYSGGMQRRLCVATALIGDPQVIMLDEPTSGVDPAGKRHLWNTLQRLQRIGKIVVLASHNVQECEILCGRIGLLISGRMRYVDSTVEVKKMFLNGFTVSFRFKHSDKGESLFPIGDLKQEIETVLGECILREAHVTMLRYLIPQRGQNWGDLVKKLESIRNGLDGVESYSITDSSLEEVFHALAEMDSDSSNVLSTTRITCLQQCLMGKCCADDYA
ncbi:unnamed protein product [Allacma fusca]|uniref:ABC transporter domain-containing protein n=1 Tax=Allacma fusca TaxID=39272 RepID=A0A8J2P5Y8_9HEXA|nr:unnamed protein product [Allacma fusca]